MLWHNTAHQVKDSYYQHLSGCVVTLLHRGSMGGGRAGYFYTTTTGGFTEWTSRFYCSTSERLSAREACGATYDQHLPTFGWWWCLFSTLVSRRMCWCYVCSGQGKWRQGHCTAEAGVLAEGSVCKAHQGREDEAQQGGQENIKCNSSIIHSAKKIILLFLSELMRLCQNFEKSFHGKNLQWVSELTR